MRIRHSHKAWSCNSEASATMTPLSAGKKGRKGAGAKKGAAAVRQAAWEWLRSREQILRALASLLAVDFTPLFQAAHEKTRCVDICVEAVGQAG